MLDVEVRQRVLDVASAAAAIAAAEDGVSSAAEARRVVAERFAAGVATNTDVLDAQVALLQAELDRTRALANAHLAAARLDRRGLGRLNRSERPDADARRAISSASSRAGSARFTAVDRVSFEVARGRDLRLPRRERRRQVDDDPHALRPAQADLGHGDGRRRRREPRSRRRQAAHRLHVAEVLALRGAHRRSEHPVLRRALRAGRRPHRAAAQVRRRDGRARRAASTPGRASSPAAGASGWRSGAPSSTSRASCFSTSRPAASIRCRAASSGASSRSCRAAASRSSSPRTISTKPSTATASPSSTPASWPRSARRAS